MAFSLFFILLRYKFLIYKFTNSTMTLTVLWPNWLILEKCDELKNWLFEQPVDNKSCSSIQFLLRQFYQKYKKVLCRVLGLESSIPWNIRFFFQADSFEPGLKIGPCSCIYYCSLALDSLLFNICISDLIRICNDTEFSSFSDDTTLCAYGMNIDKVIKNWKKT